MLAEAAEAEELRQGLEARVREIEAVAAETGKALMCPPPRNRAQIEGLVRAVQRHIMQIPPVFQKIQSRLADVTREASSKIPPERLPQPWYDLGTRVGLVRMAVNQWPRIEPVVRIQISEPKEKLLPPMRSGSGAAARAALADAAFDRLHRILNPLEQDPEAAVLGAYADIGLPQSKFMALVHAAHRVCLAQGRDEMRFLDVGCGMGLKLVSAAEAFDAVAGIELDAGYAARARDFVAVADLAKSQVVEADARHFEHYSHFNIIYLFRPLEDAVAMAGLERYIAESVDAGTLFMAPYNGFAARHRDYGHWSLAEGLYVSGMTRASASALRRRAQFIGPALRPPPQPLSSLWTPILSVSHANGFDLQRDGRLDHV